MCCMTVSKVCIFINENLSGGSVRKAEIMVIEPAKFGEGLAFSTGLRVLACSARYGR